MTDKIIEGTRNGEPRRRLVLGLLCTAFFTVVTDSTSVFTALPSIQSDVDFNGLGVHWVVTAFALTSGGFLLLGGRLSDHLGRRRMFLCGTGIFAAASFLCGVAWSPVVLILARAVQGAAGAITTPAALSILLRTFPDGPSRNRALGIWGALGGIGATAGLLLGGPVTEFLGWEWIFFVNIPLGIAVLIAGRLVLEPDERRSRETPRFDIAGALAVTGALTVLVHTIVGIPRYGLSDTRTLGGGVACALLFGLFVHIERRSAAPLVPFRIFSSPVLVGGNVVVLVAGMAVDGMLYLFTVYSQAVLGYSALQFGLTMTVMTGSSVVAVYLGQELVSRFGFRVVASVGMGLLSLASLLLARSAERGGAAAVPALLIFGIGMGAAFVASQIAALSDVAPSDEGLAAGIEETSFAIGSPLGVAVVAAVSRTYADRPDGSNLSGVTDGFVVAFAAVALLTTIGLVVATLPLKRSTTISSTNR